MNDLGTINSGPIFSIITVCLNSAQLLKETIESVTAQEFTNFEYIIVDGGSTDESLEILTRFKDDITVLVSEPDHGVYYAMNKAIALAKGQYLHFLNAGDVFLHERVLGIVADQVPDADADIFVGSGVRCSKETGQLIFLEYQQADFNMEFFRQRTINHQCLFARLEIFQSRRFDTRYRMLADYHWLIAQLLVDQVSIEYRNIGVVRYLNEGLSNQNYDLFLAEKKQILEEFSHIDEPAISHKNADLVLSKETLISRLRRYFFG